MACLLEYSRAILPHYNIEMQTRIQWTGFGSTSTLSIPVRMSEEDYSALGSFIHKSLPADLRVDPYASSVVPRTGLEKSSFSIRKYVEENRQRETQDNEMEEASTEDTGVEETPDIPREGSEGTPVILEEVEDPDSNSTHIEAASSSFGNFMFDIYQSASFSSPAQLTSQRNRFQYIQEYYRRMIQLLESSRKQVPASDEAINSLVIVVALLGAFR